MSACHRSRRGLRGVQSFFAGSDGHYRRFGAFSVGASLHAEGQRYDDLANARELSGYATLDLRGEYRITPEWRLQARVANLLDADFETAEGYNQPGQAAYLTVRYQAL